MKILTYDNAFLIFNPQAGKLRRRPHLIPRATELLRQRGVHVTALPTTGPAMAADLARGAIGRGADLILVAGGDGTVNETIQGMAGTEVPLAVLPAGTANVLAMETGLGARLEAVASRLPELAARRVALGRLDSSAGSRYFLLMAGVGLDAHIVHGLSNRIKNVLGKGAYWVAGFESLARRLEEFTTRAAGVERRTSFALAARVRNYGGDLEIARRADLLGAAFEIVLFEGANPFHYLKYFLGVLTGTLDGMKGVTLCQAAEAVFQPAAGQPPVRVQVDGEYAGDLPARVEIVPAALTLLLPQPFLVARSGK